MGKLSMRVVLIVVFVVVLLSGQSSAGVVQVVDASVSQRKDGWSFSVTLLHADSGWEHYADAWRVVSAQGDILGVRTLFHPHEHEQPFTRSLNGVSIPATSKLVYIVAHDKVHGWAKQRFAVSLESP
jgi:hypothetical protein